VICETEGELRCAAPLAFADALMRRRAVERRIGVRAAAEVEPVLCSARRRGGKHGVDERAPRTRSGATGGASADVRVHRVERLVLARVAQADGAFELVGELIAVVREDRVAVGLLLEAIG